MNPVAAVAIIIGAFFVAGLMVGFLIVTALPALLGCRGSRRGWRTYDGQRPRWPEPGVEPGVEPGAEPGGWPATRPFGADPDGAGPAGERDNR